ncbi:uncharacterized protein A4U43_C01F390 [Asparagus officinalis]|uniref:Uncharacterized protein n=1 Tax=Asparagus officinalis TaxID=4686 RepID=A0A5P1FN63_ASPOF|nr:uncharacterized protein A4U43_C01F390 [Asparagus officinalis]
MIMAGDESQGVNISEGDASSSSSCCCSVIGVGTNPSFERGSEEKILELGSPRRSRRRASRSRQDPSPISSLFVVVVVLHLLHPLIIKSTSKKERKKEKERKIHGQKGVRYSEEGQLAMALAQVPSVLRSNFEKNPQRRRGRRGDPMAMEVGAVSERRVPGNGR